MKVLLVMALTALVAAESVTRDLRTDDTGLRCAAASERTAEIQASHRSSISAICSLLSLFRQAASASVVPGTPLEAS